MIEPPVLTAICLLPFAKDDRAPELVEAGNLDANTYTNASQIRLPLRRRGLGRERYRLRIGTDPQRTQLSRCGADQQRQKLFRDGRDVFSRHRFSIVLDHSALHFHSP
jgi:hypothetical protein